MRTQRNKGGCNSSSDGIGAFFNILDLGGEIFDVGSDLFCPEETTVEELTPGIEIVVRIKVGREGFYGGCFGEGGGFGDGVGVKKAPVVEEDFFL